MGGRAFNCHVDATKFSKPFARAFRQSRSDFIEVAIEAEQNSVLPRSIGCHHRIRTVWRQFFSKPGYLMAALFKKLADGFRHAVVSKELYRLKVAAQAAILRVRLAACTSLTVRVGYSSTIASSE